MIPAELTLRAVQNSFEEVRRQLESLTRGNIDMSQRRIINAGNSVQPFDYVTQVELQEGLEAVSAETDLRVQGILNASTIIRRGPYASRGAAAAHPNTVYLASDRDYIGFLSTGAIWVYAFGVHRDEIANRPTPTSDETNYPFYATDTFVLYYWSGSAWVEDILSTIERFGGTTSSFPALKRSSAILQARLADDSAHTDIEVLDEAYDATTWNASLEVPTKNAVRDKIETVTAGETAALVSDTAYDATSWNGVTTIAPSKNAVRDKIETLLGSNAYTPSNVTTDRAYDANSTSIDEIADVLGTLIADLQGKGILS